VFCVQCGCENPEGSRFCMRCGNPIPQPAESDDREREQESGSATGGLEQASSGEAPPSVESLADQGPGLPPQGAQLLPVVPEWLRDAARSGWDRPWWGALRSAAWLFGLGFVLALLVRFAVGDDWTSVGSVLPLYKLAGVLGFVLARVPIRLDGSLNLAVVGGGGNVSMVVSLLGGFGVMAWSLVAAGRVAVAGSEAGHQVRVAVVQGVKIGVAFAAILYVASFLVSLVSDVVSFGPSHPGALGVGLLWGFVFGTVGGLRAAHHGDWFGLIADAVPDRFQRWVHATWGALRGVGNGLAVAALVTVLLVGYAIVQSSGSETAAGGGGLAEIVLTVIAGLLVLPSAVVDGLLFAHGGTMQIGASVAGLPRASAGFNLLEFPKDAGLASGLAPWYLFLGLLIPIGVVLAAGHAAAARAGVRSRDEANKVGVRVGVPYAILLWVLAMLARTTVDVAAGGYLTDVDLTSSGKFAIGISLVGAFFLPLLWGSIGGVAGARYYLSRLAPTEQTAAHRSDSGSTSSPTNRFLATKPAPDGTTRPCAGCGSPVAVGDRFCMKCGTEQPTGLEGGG
jgi:hypothetical protein